MESKEIRFYKFLELKYSNNPFQLFVPSLRRLEVYESIDIEVGLDFLKKDEKMNVLINKFGSPEFDIIKDYFQSLLRSIVYQQLRGKSAKAIYDRFIDLIPKNSLISPKDVLNLSKDDMRMAGLSFQKIKTLLIKMTFFALIVKQ